MGMEYYVRELPYRTEVEQTLHVTHQQVHVWVHNIIQRIGNLSVYNKDE